MCWLVLFKPTGGYRNFRYYRILYDDDDKYQNCSFHFWQKTSCWKKKMKNFPFIPKKLVLFVQNICASQCHCFAWPTLQFPAPLKKTWEEEKDWEKKEDKKKLRKRLVFALFISQQRLKSMKCCDKVVIFFFCCCCCLQFCVCNSARCAKQ